MNKDFNTTDVLTHVDPKRLESLQSIIKEKDKENSTYLIMIS
jgi:hypothetical protein